MSRVLRVLCLVSLSLLLAGPGLAQPQGLRLGPGDVWTLPQAAWSACLERQPPVTDCLTQLMERGGATRAALDVHYILEGDGYLSEFQEMGRVDLATVSFPLRANTNEALYCVNGKPPLVSTELDENAVNITADPAYAGLRRTFPDLVLWPTSARYRTMETRPDGGQSFVFAYPLLNGCHACALAGYALIALDFAADGTYRGPRLVRLEPARR